MHKSKFRLNRRMNKGKDTTNYLTYGVSTKINKHHLYHKDQGIKMQRRHELICKNNQDKTGIFFIPKSERKRLHNQLDPSFQGYFEWLSTIPAGHQAQHGGVRLHGLRLGRRVISKTGKTVSGLKSGEMRQHRLAFSMKSMQASRNWSARL